jgi:hypothetical protein
MRPDDVGLGGFDSHALPPRAGRGRTQRLFAAAAILFGFGLAPALQAQGASSARAGVTARSDSTRPPISPKQAFLYSLLVPGLAQAKLDRPMVGAGFFLVEAFAIALIHRTADDLRLARAYQRDSIPLRFVVDPLTGVPQLDASGKPMVAEWAAPYYSKELVKVRRLQLEDWTAVLLFNHLISGAEAFVGAQLWDLPQHVQVRAAPRAGGGFTLGATIAR